MQSWFFNASVVRLPAEQNRVGLGFTATLTEGEGGGVGVGGAPVIPMTTCLKIVAYHHTQQVSGG